MKCIVVILVFIIFTIACQSAAEQQVIAQKRMEAEVEERVASYKDVLKKNCQERVLTEATRIADSIIALEARLESDTASKPIRPEKPETQILQDTTPVKPFLKNPNDTIPNKKRQ